MIGVLSGPAQSDILMLRISMKQVRVSGIARGNYTSKNVMVDYLEKSVLRQFINDTFDPYTY